VPAILASTKRPPALPFLPSKGIRHYDKGSSFPRRHRGLLLPVAAVAQIARNEIHSFQTISPSDQQFLMKKEGAPSPTIAGELRIPRPGTDRMPAVVLLHGSDGVTNNIDAWAREIASTGTAVFIVDSFTGRNLVNVAADQDRLSRFAQVVDAYRALDLLTKHPRIDPKRIAVMGFSRGGGAAHWAAMERFHEAYGSKDVAFAGFVAFYPTCNRSLRGSAEVSSKPIRILHGTADDYVPIAECRAYVDRQRAAGSDIALTEVPGAHHIFDEANLASEVRIANFQNIFEEANLPSEVRIANVQTTRNCPLIEEADDGVLVNSATRRPFTYASDPCVERGVTIGHIPVGLVVARRLVREFIDLALNGSCWTRLG
jgi:dienelactone hydrolase